MEKHESQMEWRQEDSILKLSKLNEVAVASKPTERQNVTTCLLVFCFERIAALETHPEIDQNAVKGSSNILKIIVEMRQIFNVKNVGEDIKLNDTVFHYLNFYLVSHRKNK